MRRASVALFALVSVLVGVCFGGDKEVTFNSNPSGAQVELNGRVIGTTPLNWKFPDYWFGSKRWVTSAHASQPMQIRLIKEGYAPKVFTRWRCAPPAGGSSNSGVAESELQP